MMKISSKFRWIQYQNLGVTIDMIKAIREQTGCGMAEARKIAENKSQPELQVFEYGEWRTVPLVIENYSEQINECVTDFGIEG
jgi:hypothetical protein